MNKKHISMTGGLISIFGALVGIVGHFVLFQAWYFRGMVAESAEEGCEILLKFLHPFLSDVGILGGLFFAVAAYGFFAGRKWSPLMAVTGAVLSLQGAWFINVPYMAADLPPIYFTLFFPFLVIYFVLLRSVLKLGWGHITIALLAGLTFVFTFMNGVSSLSRIITIGSPLFVLTQRLHWVAMAGCGVAAIAIVLQPREWVWLTAVTASVLELVVGVPLAVFTTLNLGRFSLFSLGPIACLILLVVLFWPGLWKNIENGVEQSPFFGKLAAKPA